MDSLKQKVAFLQGLTKGLDIKGSSPEGKVLLGVVDVLESVADEVQELYLAQQELENFVETIDDDLAQIEEEVFEEETCENMVEVDCPVCHEHVHFEADVLEEDDAVEVTCPSCGGVVYYNDLDSGESYNHLMHETSEGNKHPGI